ncbi:PcfJ domain-containing protein [Bacteroides ovatus]|nr:PcfJ domain-containing protein [Bacteroides ovatus]
MWFDYLKLLEHYRKDLHNAHYVCPKNLKKAHDLYVARKKRDDEKERKAKEMQQLLKLKKDAENYIKEKSKFFDLKMSDGKIVVVPLKSLEEFQQEGEIMHHCVFTNKYYKEKDSLILSARIGKKHIETVEVNLKTFSIVQSRGACNSNTEYHNRIIGLVKKNMNLIRQKLTA